MTPPTWLARLLDWFGRGGVPPWQPPPPPLPPPMPPAPRPTDDPNLTTWQLVDAMNRERARAGRPALAHDGRLTVVSRRFAAEIAYRGVLTHARLSGVPYWGEIGVALGWAPGAAAACSENAAEGQPDAAQVVADWMGSPGHKANVLGPYTTVGAGVAASADGTNFWIADFAA